MRAVCPGRTAALFCCEDGGGDVVFAGCRTWFLMGGAVFQTPICFETCHEPHRHADLV